MQEDNSRGILFFRLALLGVILVYVLGWSMEIADVDSAQYASISREMMESGSFLKVLHKGHDYGPDKPPLLFWLSSLSLSIFGVSNWAFRLPSFLFGLLGILGTYGLARRYYDATTASIATLIIATSQAFFLMNNDPKTDLMLTGSCIFAVWQLTGFLETRRFRYILAGFIGVGLAMLAKGPIGAVVPGSAIALQILARRQWRALWRWEWLCGILIVAVILAPMCYGTYLQFGEKGLRFYFWEQSFGRITGENVWKNDAGPFFLSQSLLWAFLPWSLPFIPALFFEAFSFVRAGFRIQKGEAASLGGFLLPFFALSLSHYQLPHYAFVTFPFAAVLTACFLKARIDAFQNSIAWNVMQVLQQLVLLLLISAAGFLMIYCFPVPETWPIYALGGFVILFIILFIYSPRKTRFVRMSIVSAIIINFILNTRLYPTLFRYQSTSSAGHYVTENHIPQNKFFAFQDNGAHSLDFTARRIVRGIDIEDTLRKNPKAEFWMYTNQDGMNRLKSMNTVYHVVREWDNFGVQLLSITFINPETRNKAVGKAYLVRVN